MNVQPETPNLLCMAVHCRGKFGGTKASLHSHIYLSRLEQNIFLVKGPGYYGNPNPLGKEQWYCWRAVLVVPFKVITTKGGAISAAATPLLSMTRPYWNQHLIECTLTNTYEIYF